MCDFPSREAVARLRTQYPAGTREELIAMDDPYATLKPGDRATVQGVYDAGHLLCQWDGGSTLNLIPGVDAFRIVSSITDTIREQILAIRASAETNMLDANAVQRLEYDRGFYELVNFIQEDRRAYARYIITGEC